MTFSIESIAPAGLQEPPDNINQATAEGVAAADASPAFPRHLSAIQSPPAVLARLQRDGRRYQRYFPLSRHGDWETTVTAAEDWLQATLAQLPAARNRSPSERNRSGVVGVHYHSGKRTLKNGFVGEYPSYVARWPGSRAGVRWMFSTHTGEENAFVLACLCRQLETASRCVVGEAFRALTDEERTALLACKRPLPAPGADGIETSIAPARADA